jgi:L-seryl-tRNA(Ser) seleniumtransferase
MITLPLDEIKRRANNLKSRLMKNIPDHVEIQVVDDSSQVGGGALPSQQLPTKVVAISSESISVKSLEKYLRDNRPSIIARISKDQLRIDIRTVSMDEEKVIESSLRKILNGHIN